MRTGCRNQKEVWIPALALLLLLGPAVWAQAPDAPTGLRLGKGGGPGVPGPSDGGSPPWADIGSRFYVRAGAGGNGSGTDWNNAYQDLPSTLVRGAVYYLADGSYTRYVFDDAESSTTTIYVVKATDTYHGTSTGWQSGYGDGVAEFAPETPSFEDFSFTTGYYYLDGGTGRQIRIRGDFQNACVAVRANGITLANLELDAAFQASGGVHTAGSCAVLLLMRSTTQTIRDIRVEGCDLHSAADDGAEVAHVIGLDFINNVIHDLMGYGTDGPGGSGPCNNGHSDAFELNDVVDGFFSGNFVYNIRGTSGLFFMGGSPGSVPCQQLIFVNNIFYVWDNSGLLAYFQGVHDVKLYSNVFWGRVVGGKYGGIAVGNDVQGMEMRNNIIHSLNFTHLGGVYNPAEHYGDHNLFGNNAGDYPPAATDIVASDPQFQDISGLSPSAIKNPSPTISDFALRPTSPAVNTGAVIDGFATDINGTARPLGTRWDIGAVESH